MIIYLITNNLNGKQYVGQTNHTLEKRIRGHRWKSSAQGGKNMPIAMAIQKYGWENFTAEVICECSSQEEMNEKEMYYAKKLNTFSPNGYNLSAGGAFGLMTAEVRKRIAKANTGKKRTPEQCKRISEAHIGLPISDELRKKRSINRKGMRLPDTAYENVQAKTYELIDPAGKRQIVTNLREFCSANGYDYIKMHGITTGRKKTYKGWHLATPINPPTVKKRRIGKTYAFISPDGKEITTNNLAKFCCDNSLGYTTMLDVFAGRRVQHKGYKALQQKETQIAEAEFCGG